MQEATTSNAYTSEQFTDINNITLYYTREVEIKPSASFLQTLDRGVKLNLRQGKYTCLTYKQNSPTLRTIKKNLKYYGRKTTRTINDNQQR